MFRNILRAACLAALALTLPAVPLATAQQRTLHLATEGAYPPFNEVDAAGKLHGFDVDIGNALCAEMKVSCEWVVQDWDGMIPALQAGKFDVIVASMFITPERQKQIDFTQPYYRTPAGVIVDKSSSITGIKPEDLAGKTIGVQASSVYAPYVEQKLPASVPKAYTGVPEMLSDLASGRLDAVNDDLIVLDAFLKSPEGACCRLVGTIERIPEIHGPGAGLAVRKGDPLLGKLDQALAAIKADGRFKQINDRYFSFDISGGKK